MAGYGPNDGADQCAREPFDRKRRRRIFARAARIAGAEDAPGFLTTHMAGELLERLSWVRRDFGRVLILGHASPALDARLAEMGCTIISATPWGSADTGAHICCDEDFLPFTDHSFDLVIALGTLDSVNDLPGALALIRRILTPDGLLLAGFIGAGSLPRLKAAMLAADEARGRGAAAHIHPQVDVRAAGDLLQRAGFAMPVADGETLNVRYAGLPGLIRDLRAMGGSNMLSGKHLSLGKAGLVAAAERFARDADPDGKTGETFALVYLSAWAPSPDQPKPARRGSGTVSLASALGKRES